MESDENRSIARGLVAFTDRTLDLVVITLILVSLAYAIYSIWDTDQIYTASEATVYETYKPTEKADSPTYDELQKINPDVCAWIDIYGTGIDYPVVQGENNDDYMNKTVTGDFALGGSIFLDHTNAKDFSDFNTIIYGHHMEKHEMFGDLDLFEEKEFFNEHRYGSLYFGGRLHGLTIFAMGEFPCSSPARPSGDLPQSEWRKGRKLSPRLEQRDDNDCHDSGRRKPELRRTPGRDLFPEGDKGTEGRCAFERRNLLEV